MHNDLSEARGEVNHDWKYMSPTWERVLGGKNSMWKGPEAGMCLACSRTNGEQRVERGEEVREAAGPPVEPL